MAWGQETDHSLALPNPLAVSTHVAHLFLLTLLTLVAQTRILKSHRAPLPMCAARLGVYPGQVIRHWFP